MKFYPEVPSLSPTAALPRRNLPMGDLGTSDRDVTSNE
jgi:hypothetical protein